MKVFNLFLSLIIILVCIFGLLNVACKKNQSSKVICTNQETIESGKNYYQPLIEALEKYKTDNGNFPQKLSELAPRYIPSQVITKENTYNSGDLTPEIETRFEALRPDFNSYVIKFYYRSKKECLLSKSGECSYFGDTKHWTCQ